MATKDRKQALMDLRDKVVAGENPSRAEWCTVFKDEAGCRCSMEAVGAAVGWLDCAKALQEAVLPGYWWCIDAGAVAQVASYSALPYGTILGEESNPARAWLIAILEALIAEESN